MIKKVAVPGFEPGSSGSQPLMLTTTLYHQQPTGESREKKKRFYRDLNPDYKDQNLGC